MESKFAAARNVNTQEGIYDDIDGCEQSSPIEAKTVADSYVACNESEISYIGEYDRLRTRINPLELMTDQFKGDIRRNRADWPELTIKHPDPLLAIYDTVRRTGVYNAFQAKVVLPSLLKYHNWEAMGTGHVDDPWIIALVKFGFPLQFNGTFEDIPMLEHENHHSAVNYAKHVESYIVSEVANQILIGPFTDKPFTRLSVAPIMTRPKSNPAKRRIIVDYSYPEGEGINSRINKNEVFGTILEHDLPTVSQAVDVIRSRGFEVHLATIDLERAYRNFKTDPYDWPLTCIRYNDQYFVDTALPFGSRASSLYVQRVAEFIQRILRQKGIYMSMYLDDGLIITDDGQDHQAVLRTVIGVLRALGLPLSYDKIQMPSKRCVFLGIDIDVQKRQMTIPRAKLDAFREVLSEVEGKQTITRAQLQSLIGSVNHISKCVRGARLFMNRFLAALRQAESKIIRVDREIKADIAWFKQYMISFNGTALINHTQIDVAIQVDSCLVGSAGICADICYVYRYPDEMARRFHITQLEALNCLMAIRAFTSGLRNKVVEVHCDNMPAVMAFTNSRGRDHILNAIARAVWYHAANRNLEVQFRHVPGVDLPFVDALSRAYLDEQSMNHANNIITKNNWKTVHISPTFHDFNRYL